MTEKTTEEVVISEAGNAKNVANQSRRKPAARKAATTRKKAANKEEAVEPAQEANETVVKAVAPAKKTNRRGRKPKQTAEEATPNETENEISVIVDIEPDETPVSSQEATSEPVQVEEVEETVEVEEKSETNAERVVAEEPKLETQQSANSSNNNQHQSSNNQKVKPIPPFNPVRIDSIVDMVNAPKNQLLLNDQQIQQLTVDEAVKRFRWIEGTLAWVLNYDVVISDTNIWLELLVGHTSSHSDPKVNARLMFERQLEFISKLVRFRGGRFMMMSETYEEIDRFATQQAPTNYKDADFNDEALCRNVSARLAKRLILSQQRENRLKIEGICAESHHAAFADPAIIRKTVELFSTGKRVLLLTNDASVAIRSMGMCDDLQRINDIDDETWEHIYAPLRPMVITMDDLKVLDLYTRQYHFLQMAAGKQWMEDVPQRMEKRNVEPLIIWLDGFRPGDKQSEMHKQQKQQKQQQNQQKQEQKQQNQTNQQKQQKQQKQQQSKSQSQEQTELQSKQQVKQEQPKVEQKRSNVEPKVEAPVESVETPMPVEVAAVPDVVENTEVQVNADNVESQEQPKQQRKRPQRRRPQRKKPMANNEMNN